MASWRLISLVAVSLLVISQLALRAEEATQRLEYPADLRAFRAKALKADGVFAPDIAFSLRTCPNCRKPYVFGTFPRLKRQPFDSLAAVHKTMETVAQKKPPSGTMYSPGQGKLVARACPACGEDEGANARPDKALFCHVIPETGDDLQIEYEIGDGRLVSRKFFRIPKTGEAQAISLADESEGSFKKAFGHYFSLRAVWNEIFEHGKRKDLFSFAETKIPYRQVAPGMWFIFRPPTVDAEDFKEFAETRLKDDQDKGLFTRLDTPLKTDNEPNSGQGTYREWAVDHEAMLTSGTAECFVAYSFPELRKAARDVLATRSITLDADDSSASPQGAKGATARMQKGEFWVEINFGPLVAQAVMSGLSLHHACALHLTIPVFTVEGAERLSQAIRANLPRCVYEVRDGRYLILRDPLQEERKLDLIALADKLDPRDAYLFDLFGSRMLAWDAAKNGFAAKPAERDVAPTGMPAFVERRIRPAGHLRTREAREALFEPHEDRDGKAYEVCYTSECTTSVVYLDPTKERFKDITLEDARKLHDQMGGTLPQYIDAQDQLALPGDYFQQAALCKAFILCGHDLASLAVDNGRAARLALASGFGPIEPRFHLYAVTTNAVALVPRKLTSDEVKLVQSRANGLLAESGLERGLELGLHFDLPAAEPRGKVMRRAK